MTEKFAVRDGLEIQARALSGESKRGPAHRVLHSYEIGGREAGKSSTFEKSIPHHFLKNGGGGGKAKSFCLGIQHSSNGRLIEKERAKEPEDACQRPYRAKFAETAARKGELMIENYLTPEE